MGTSYYIPRRALLTEKVINCYRIAWRTFCAHHLQSLQESPVQLEAWLQANRYLDLGTGAYRLDTNVEETISRVAVEAGEELTEHLIAFIDNLLLAFLLPKPAPDELDAPPTGENFPAWFFYNYGIIIDRPEDTAPVALGLYLAIRRCIEAEHYFVGGFWLSVFYLPQEIDHWVKGGGWIPTLNRVVLVVPSWKPDFDARFFLSFLHEYPHFLDCCVLGQNVILNERTGGQDYDLFYFSAAWADRLGFARQRLTPRYRKAEFEGAKNRWWRSLDFGTETEETDFDKQYKNHSPAECTAELYASYFGHGRNYQKMTEFAQQEKDWFREMFLVELKRNVSALSTANRISM